MSTSSGAAGVFGILLSTVLEIADGYSEFKADVLALEADGDDLETLIREKNEELEAILSTYQPLFSGLLAVERGIIVPTSATLHYTGNEDDRPADCGTPADEWVLGFGIFTKPWEYPEMLDSFRAHAEYHTWAWVG